MAPKSPSIYSTGSTLFNFSRTIFINIELGNNKRERNRLITMVVATILPLTRLGIKNKKDKRITTMYIVDSHSAFVKFGMTLSL